MTFTPPGQVVQYDYLAVQVWLYLGTLVELHSFCLQELHSEQPHHSGKAEHCGTGSYHLGVDTMEIRYIACASATMSRIGINRESSYVTRKSHFGTSRGSALHHHPALVKVCLAGASYFEVVSFKASLPASMSFDAVLSGVAWSEAGAFEGAACGLGSELALFAPVAPVVAASSEMG